MQINCIDFPKERVQNSGAEGNRSLTSVIYDSLNSNTDTAISTINKLQTLGDDDEEEWKRKTYMKLVLANQFTENKNLCFEESC